MHMGHLPVRNVHFLVVPQGQREHHSVTSCKHSGDVGLHHLKEGSRIACWGGLHPPGAANRELPETHQGPQGQEACVCGHPQHPGPKELGLCKPIASRRVCWPKCMAVLTPQHLGTDCHRAGGSETKVSPAWRSQCNQDSCSSGGCNTRLTLLTTMKPLESMLMPLCLRNPVAGTAPAGESKGLFFL